MKRIVLFMVVACAFFPFFSCKKNGASIDNVVVIAASKPTGIVVGDSVVFTLKNAQNGVLANWTIIPPGTPDSSYLSSTSNTTVLVIFKGVGQYTIIATEPNITASISVTVSYPIVIRTIKTNDPIYIAQPFYEITDTIDNGESVYNYFIRKNSIIDKEVTVSLITVT
ncbi:MAG TPA: hypothetical protein VK559_07105 [Ferruginibacter sp.]|nr:hypothetical protein [Ferruginibacter sp.]